jgi:hypothetical protein
MASSQYYVGLEQACGDVRQKLYRGLGGGGGGAIGWTQSVRPRCGFRDLTTVGHIINGH